MPDPIPADDLYARLGVRRDADRASIERAWRALLKRHHPDVAGAESLEAAKRINVAHDWLADPARRARYDRAIGRRMDRADRLRGSPGRAPWRPAASGRTPGGDGPTPSRPEAAALDGLDAIVGPAAAAVRAHLRRVAALTADDVDRLAVGVPVDPTPSLRPILPPELQRRIRVVDRMVRQRMPAHAAGVRRALDAARSFGRAQVLEPYLGHLVADREAVLETMRHAWEAAVSQPRYGPNGREVRALLARFRGLAPDEALAIAHAAATLGPRSESEPWPVDSGPADYPALAISAALARRDASAVAAGLVGLRPSQWRLVRSAMIRLAHLATLRPIFPAREYARLRRGWLDAPAPPGPPTATVRRAGRAG